MASNDAVTIGRGRCVRETEKAILVQIDDEDDERWIPKSVVHDDSEVYEMPGEGTVVVQKWWATREGLG